MHKHSSDIESESGRAARAQAASTVQHADTPKALFIGSKVFRRAAFGNHHPLKIVRHSAVLDLAQILGWLPSKAFRASGAASIRQLAGFHDADYIAALQKAERSAHVSPDVRRRFNIGNFENPVFPGLFERASTTVGGSIAAARLALAGHVVFHPSGGTHHGRPDRASGFCYFNDPVFAIRTLLENGRSRVVYVDLDAHHGDGVEAAFVDEPRVMTVSIHEQDRWPYSGTTSDTGHAGARNLPVPPGFNDSELEYLMEYAVLPLAEDFAADALVICCGADCLAGDPLSGMMLSNTALWNAIESLLVLSVPTVVLGGGGYNPWTVTRYWTGLWGRLSKQPFPDRLPQAAVALLREMECDLVDDEDMDDEWFETLADSPRPGAIRDTILSLAAGVLH